MALWIGAIVGGMIGILVTNGNLVALVIGAVVGGFLGWNKDAYMEDRD